MAWLWLTLGALFLFSVGAHVDKHLLSRYFQGSAPGALILFSALFSLVVLPVLAAIQPRVLAIAPGHAAILLAGGALNIAGVILSLYAMQRDDPSVVATLFQMIPVFSYGLAYAVLGETLSGVQVLAAGLVIVGAVFVSLDLTKGRTAIQGGVLLPMTLASLFLAANAVLFKKVALTEDFWVSTFWSYASLAVVGVGLFAFARPFRRQFLRTLRLNRVPVIALNVGNEVLAVVGYVMITYASLLVPVALVSALSGLQPTMVFALGVLLAWAFPRLSTERLARRQVVQKVVGIIVTLVGTWLLHR